MLAEVLKPNATLLDPFAGTGLIHRLPFETTAIEIEPEWANQVPGHTIVGDFFKVSARWRHKFDAVMTSPVYPNRMTDHHDNRDTHKACGGEGCKRCDNTGISPRRSYRHDLGRMPSEGSSATLSWGEAHRRFHVRAWHRVFRIVRPGGHFLLNISDHVQDFEMQPVAIWHTATIAGIGFDYVEACSAVTQRMKHGRNRESRAPNEWCILFRKPEE